MADYIVSRTLVLGQKAEPRASGPAILALQQANELLEQSMPRQQPVPAYQPTVAAEGSAQARGRSGE